MVKLDHEAGYESFGTRVLFRSNEAVLLDETVETAREALLGNLTETAGPFPLVMDITSSRRGLRLVRNGSYITAGRAGKTFFNHLNGIIRISIGEYAPELVFLHSGAVAWKGKGIILPADSFTGKSSLVTELVKKGAEYYSDDFAIVDKGGLLHPFPRRISMRTREKVYTPYELDPRELGITVGTKPLPIALVLLTRYKPRSRWAPEILSSGEGVLRTVPFALALRQRPDMCLNILNRIAAHATIISTPRGDAAKAADRLFKFFDSDLN